MKTKQILFIAGMLIMSTFSQCCKKEDTICKEKANRSSCICPAVVDPVCGCNGKTYGNSCEAECNGIASYTMGACK